MTSYTTKDSGERQEFSTGMRRDTETGKPRFDLTEPINQPFSERMSTRLAMLMGRGAEKYGDRNWEKAETVEEVLRYLSSLGRHVRQYQQQVLYELGLIDEYEEDVMSEDHGAATMFNIIGAEYVKGRILRKQSPSRILKVQKDITPEELIKLRERFDEQVSDGKR